jgi:hypothetical protein
MQRAFVTGAAGFIGSSLCDRLLQQWVNYCQIGRIRSALNWCFGNRVDPFAIAALDFPGRSRPKAIAGLHRGIYGGRWQNLVPHYFRGICIWENKDSGFRRFEA